MIDWGQQEDQEERTPADFSCSQMCILKCTVGPLVAIWSAGPNVMLYAVINPSLVYNFINRMQHTHIWFENQAGYIVPSL